MLIIETVAVITGLLAAWYARLNDKVTWVYSLISVILFTYLFYSVGLVGSVLLQLYFIIVSIVGLWTWRDSSYNGHHIKWSNKYAIALSFYVSIMGAIVFGYLLSNSTYLTEIFGIVQYPYLDSFIWWGSMMAVVLLAYRRIESWILWIVVDIVAIYVYLMVDMYIVVIQYIILLINAIWGLYQWNKQKNIGRL